MDYVKVLGVLIILYAQKKQIRKKEIPRVYRRVNKKKFYIKYYHIIFYFVKINIFFKSIKIKLFINRLTPLNNNHRYSYNNNIPNLHKYLFLLNLVLHLNMQL